MISVSVPLLSFAMRSRVVQNVVCFLSALFLYQLSNEQKKIKPSERVIDQGSQRGLKRPKDSPERRKKTQEKIVRPPVSIWLDRDQALVW